jgi:hypothetical protein
MNAYEVEFVGGPLDGHTYSFFHSPAELPPLVKLGISADVVRVLIGEKRKVLSPPSSLAVYCLDRNGDEWRYSHVASIPAEEPQFDEA